jgi:hypothetical protein
MQRMRSLCDMRSHSSLKLSSLLSTLPQVHASTVHRWGPAASGPGQQLPHAAAMLGLHVARSMRDDPLLDKTAGAAMPACQRRRELRNCRHHDQQQLAAQTARRAMWHARTKQLGPRQGGIRPAQEARARALPRKRDAAQQASHAVQVVRCAPPVHVCRQRSISGIARSASSACSRCSVCRSSAPAPPSRTRPYAGIAHSMQ